MTTSPINYITKISINSIEYTPINPIKVEKGDMIYISETGEIKIEHPKPSFVLSDVFIIIAIIFIALALIERWRS